MEDRGKASVTSVYDGSLSGHTVYFDIRLFDDESALANPELAKPLIQAILLPVGRENRKSHTVVEIFFSFYLMILRVSFLSHFFFD